MNLKKVNPSEEGFTLVELLVVIAILAILASISFTYYIEHRKKALLTSHALPVADACAKDIIAYCIDLSPETSQTIDINSIDLKNCESGTVLEHNLTINLTGTFTCNPGGNVDNGTVEARLTDTPNYKAVCELKLNAIKCYVSKE